MIQRHSHFILSLLILTLLLRPNALYAEAAFELPQAPAQPAPAAVPKPQSRSSDAKAASAIAMVGAMAAMASCAKLKNEARKARKAGDTKGAQMYDMMAMMQCAQAAKDMADAAKNNNQKDQLQENQTPGMAQLGAQTPFKTPETPSDKIDQKELSEAPSESSDERSPDPDPAPARAPAAVRDTTTDKTTLANIPIPTTVPVVPKIKRPGDDFIIPGLIDKPTVSASNDANKFSGDAGGTSAGNSFASSLKAPSFDDLNKGTADATKTKGEAETKAKGPGHKDGVYDDEGGAGSGASKSGDGGDSGGMNLNDMMAGLFGGPAGAGGGFMGAQGLMDYITPTPTSPTTGLKMTIFEAASILYQRADGKKVKRIKTAHNSDSFLPSQLAKLSKD